MNLPAPLEFDPTEAARLKALHDFAVLDTLPEDRFDRLTKLAATLFDAPIAVISLIDEHRQWFKSRIGLDDSETQRDHAFCNHTIRGPSNSILVVPDAALDVRFSNNPFVTNEPAVRFYAGATLTTASGHNIGTLCVIDRQPRQTPSDADLNRLSVIAQMVVDQLELGRASAAVAEQKRLLSLAEGMSGVGHWRMTVSTGDIFWSDEVYRIHGVDPVAFNPTLGSGVAFYHPEDRAMVSDLVERAVSKGEDFMFQARLVRPDRQVRHVTSKASCERNQKGATTALIGVYQDITEQVERLEAIAQSSARYRLLTENANDMVTKTGSDGVFTYVSPSVMALTGYTPGEVVGRRALDFIVEEDKARLVTAFAEASAERKGWTIEYRVRCKDGRIIWVEARPSLAFDEDGAASGVTDVIRDITDRKAMEADLERARAEAVQAAIVKGEFLANMSHELRTPLTSILGFSDLLQREPTLDEQSRGYVQRVIDSSQALLSIVNDVLDFSKLEAGQVIIQTRPVETEILFAGALAMVRPQAHIKGLELVLELGVLPKSLKLDDARLRQILLNLLSNAIKFTEAGRVTLRAGYDKSAQRLRCEVLDTGIGISKDSLERLFQRFSQVDGSMARSHSGTGLGLAICKGLAEAMGGTVGAASILGQGSRFWCELNCEVAGEPTAAATDAVGAAKMLRGVRVLTADNDLISRELMRLILSPFAVDLKLVENGDDAVHAAGSEPFDIILLDMNLPGLDGLAAARKIRNGAFNTSSTLIAIASKTVMLSSHSPFDSALSKPLIAADVVKLLATIAEGSKASSLKARHGLA